MIAIVAQLVRRVVLACALLAVVVVLDAVLGHPEWRRQLDDAAGRYRGPYDDPRAP